MLKWFLLGMVYITGAFLTYILDSILLNITDYKEERISISIVWPFAMVIIIPYCLAKLFEIICDMIVDQIKRNIKSKKEQKTENNPERKHLDNSDFECVSYPCTNCPYDPNCTNFRSCNKWLLWALLEEARGKHSV